MKKKSNLIWIFSIACLMAACQTTRDSKVNLTPPDTRPVYQTLVSDPSEIALLKQQLGLEIKSNAGNMIWFYVKSDSVLTRMQSLGYHVDRIEPGKTFYQIVMVDTAEEKQLSSFGLRLINREGGRLIVKGSLDELSKWSAGHQLENIGEELRPREIEVVVPAQPDIQIVYNLGIDIFSAAANKSRGYTIHGSGFDYQIDSLRRLQFSVRIIKSKI